MKDDIEKAIKELAIRAKQQHDAGDAMKMAQACLSLTHALATLQNTETARLEAKAKFG